MARRDPDDGGGGTSERRCHRGPLVWTCTDGGIVRGPDMDDELLKGLAGPSSGTHSELGRSLTKVNVGCVGVVAQGSARRSLRITL